MNLKQLRTFVRVVELQGFTLAADDLGLAQPTVSFHVQSLEKEYGVELLDRSGREIITTASGQLVYEHGRRILDLYDQSKLEVDQLNNLVRGVLIIGASTGPGEHILPQLLGRFKVLYPQIRIVLEISRTAEIIQQVQERALEIGVVGASSKEPNLVFEPFVKDDPIVIASPEHRWAQQEAIPLAAFLREPLLLQQPGAGIRTMLEKGFARQGLRLDDLNVYMEVGLQESVKTAVAENYGVGIISRFAVRRELARGTLVEVPVQELPFFRDEFFLVRNRGRKLSHLTKTFLAFAREAVQDLD